MEVRPIIPSELDAVYQLTYEAYLAAGYCGSNESLRLVHYPELDNIPQTTVFGAFKNGVLVGTNSFTVDGPKGLHVDKDYPEETKTVRGESRILGSSWRIATRGDERSSPRILLRLIGITVHEAIRAGVETMLFTFNPKHERVYKRMLNMKTVARRGSTLGLANAPSVLMRVDWEDLPDEWLPPL